MIIEGLNGKIIQGLKITAADADCLGREAIRVLEELRELVVDIDGFADIDLGDISEKILTTLQVAESLQEAILRWRSSLESAPTAVPASP
jgi:hypothetical protein